MVTEQLLQRNFPKVVAQLLFFRGRHGGVEKGGGWKTSRMTPLPKRGFGPPRTVHFPPPSRVSALFFLYRNPRQKLFWRGPKIFGRARSRVRFPPPIRFAPPPISRPNIFACGMLGGVVFRRMGGVGSVVVDFRVFGAPRF